MLKFKIFALLLMLLPVVSVNAGPPVQGIPPSYELAAENDGFQLYVDSSTLAFKLFNKASGYLWHSGLDEVIEGDRLNKSWQAFALSGISIQYFDKKATDSRISITNAEHTLEVTPLEQGMAAQATFAEPGITLRLILELESEGLRVEIPADSIVEANPDFRLARIFVYPFLGATRGSTVPGYMFLPDGVGSLVRYGDATRAKNMFFGRYYGADLGMITYMPYNEDIVTPNVISYPVFGAVHGEGENSFLAVVEKGAAYGELQVHPAGIITNFNFLYNAFIYNETYFQATNRSGAGVTTVQRQTNTFDAVVHYRFLAGAAADYVGMARSYQQYLLDQGQLHPQAMTSPNIGIRLEFLGGDKENVLLWNRFIPMTTISQMREILDQLQLAGAEVIYYGWQPQGASTMPPTALELERGLGSLDDLRALADRITANGGHFALYLEPQVALWQEGGYSARSDLAMSITNSAIEGYGRHYGYYFNQDVLQSRYTNLMNDTAGKIAAGLALDTIGSTLYSDFKDPEFFNREQAIAAYQVLLDNSPLRLGLYRPNDYLFGAAQAYYDMPSGDNGYIFTSEAVPFLPVVLAGYLPYYGGALNFSSNLQEDLLRQVEYGIYPSYFLTYEPTASMLNTRSAWIYTSSYAQWGEQIRSSYAWMNALLAPVQGQAIIAHARLAADVYATTYANNRRIIVNYSAEPFDYHGMIVAAKDALLVEDES